MSAVAAHESRKPAHNICEPSPEDQAISAAEDAHDDDFARILRAAASSVEKYPPVLHWMEYIAILLVRRRRRITRARLEMVNPDHPNSSARLGKAKILAGLHDAQVYNDGTDAVFNTSWRGMVTISLDDEEDVINMAAECLRRLQRGDGSEYFTACVR